MKRTHIVSPFLRLLSILTILSVLFPFLFLSSIVLCLTPLCQVMLLVQRMEKKVLWRQRKEGTHRKKRCNIAINTRVSQIKGGSQRRRD